MIAFGEVECCLTKVKLRDPAVSSIVSDHNALSPLLTCFAAAFIRDIDDTLERVCMYVGPSNVLIIEGRHSRGVLLEGYFVCDVTLVLKSASRVVASGNQHRIIFCAPNLLLFFHFSCVVRMPLSVTTLKA